MYVRKRSNQKRGCERIGKKVAVIRGKYIKDTNTSGPLNIADLLVGKFQKSYYDLRCVFLDIKIRVF